MSLLKTGLRAKLAVRSGILLSLQLLLPLFALAQVSGGADGFTFLLFPDHARTYALGGNVITAKGAGSASLLQNPALLDSSDSNAGSATFRAMASGVANGDVSYSRKIKSTVWALGVRYVNHGEFDQTDDFGNTVGKFYASDVAVVVGAAQTIGAFTLGASFKWVSSSIETYAVRGIAADFGALFSHPEKDVVIGLAIKNLGSSWKNYSGEAPPLPMDVRVGTSFKPTDMPVRFSLTAHHLYKFDMVYNDPALFYTYDLSGNRIPRNVKFSEKIFRHISVGAEFLIHPMFRILIGYDHLRRQEMRLTSSSGLAGLSYGFALKWKKVDVAYSRAHYLPGVAGGALSLNVDLRR